MNPSIVTDELSADPETAFELGLEWGVTHFELRGVHAGRVPELSAHLRRRLIRAVGDFGVTITAISPGLFKIPFPDREPKHSNLGWMDGEFFYSWDTRRAMLRRHRTDLLEASLEFANEVGARTLIAFSFSRGGLPGGEAPAGVAETLEEASERARAAGIDLLVENEEGHWADSGERTATLLGRVGGTIGINWDPANALIDGDTPYPDGYRHVAPMVRNVHFKDARLHTDGSWELLTEGDVAWEAQIAALAADGYDGAIAIEPHLSPPVASTRHALQRLRAFMAAAGKA